MNAEHINDDHPRMKAALSELQTIIRKRYPAATFTISHGEDPEGVYLTATVDVEDTDAIVDLVIYRLVTIQVEESLPVYFVPARPPAQIASLQRHSV